MATYKPRFTLEYMPLAEAMAPKGVHVAYTNRFWVVSPDGESITFARFGRYRSPQCNNQREVVEDIRSKLYPDHGIAFVPVVYLPQERE